MLKIDHGQRVEFHTCKACGFKVASDELLDHERRAVLKQYSMMFDSGSRESL